MRRTATFKLMMEAQKRWRLLNGKHRVVQVINLEKFIDGIHEKEIKQVENKSDQHAA